MLGSEISAVLSGIEGTDGQPALGFVPEAVPCHHFVIDKAWQKIPLLLSRCDPNFSGLAAELVGVLVGLDGF